MLVSFVTSTALAKDAINNADSDRTLDFIFGESRQLLFEGHKGESVQIILKGAKNFDRFVQSDNTFISTLNELGVGYQPYRRGFDITKNGTISVLFGNPATVGADPFFAAMQFIFHSASVLEIGPKLKNFHESGKYNSELILNKYCTSVTDYFSSEKGSTHYMILFIDDSSENKDINECIYRNALSFIGLKGISLNREISSIDVIKYYRNLMKLNLRYGSSESDYYKRNIK